MKKRKDVSSPKFFVGDHLYRLIPAFAGMTLVFLFVSYSFAAGPAQQVRVTAKVLKNKIKIGDTFRFLIQVERPRNYSVLPFPEKISPPPFEVKKRDAEPVRMGENRVKETFGFTLTVFELGELKVPPVTVRYQDEKGNPGELQTDPVAIKVVSVGKKLTDKDDIRPIKGPAVLDLGRFRDKVLGFLAGVLAVFLVKNTTAHSYFCANLSSRACSAVLHPADPPISITMSPNALERANSSAARLMSAGATRTMTRALKSTPSTATSGGKKLCSSGVTHDTVSACIWAWRTSKKAKVNVASAASPLNSTNRPESAASSQNDSTGAASGTPLNDNVFIILIDDAVQPLFPK